MTTTTRQQPRSDMLAADELGPDGRGKLQKKLEELKTLGIGGTLRKTLHDRIYRTRDYIVTEYLLEPHGPPPDPATHKEVMVVEPGDAMPDFSRHFGHAKAMETEATIRAGKLCFVVLKDGAPIALCFCALEDHYEASDRFTFTVRDGEGYFFGHLVPPGQRGFGVYARILKYAVAVLSARGCHRLHATVETWNLNALGPQLFLGFREAGEVIHLRRLFGWWNWSWREKYTGLRYARFQRKRARR